MTGLPILDHQLRTGSRSRRTAFWRVTLTAGGTIVVLGFLQVGPAAGWTPVRLGGRLFDVLSLLGLAYGLVAGPVLIADCLSSEKRQGTLPLLFLSNLPMSNIVLGTLVASALPAIYALAAFLPLLAMPFFLGGITVGEFWRTAILLVSVLAHSLALSGWISARSFSGRKALAATAATLSLWLALPWAGPAFGQAMPLARWFPDPLNFWLAGLDAVHKADPAAFYQRLATVWMLTGFWLTWAVRSVGSHLTEPIKDHRPQRIRFPQTLSPKARRVRARWYLLNPVAWVARQRSPLRAPVLVFALLFGGTAFVVWLQRDRLTPGPDALIAYLFCLHGLLKLWLAWELSRCLSRDQAEGLLEPLLATPLTEHQIVHGWITGLQSVFRWPVIMLFGMDLWVWWLSDLGEWSFPLLTMMGAVLFDTFTLLWGGLYFGLIARNATRGLLQTVGVVLLGPWLVGLALLALLTFAQLQWLVPDSSLFLCVAWIAIGLLMDAILCVHCSRQLGGNFRHLVAERC